MFTYEEGIAKCFDEYMCNLIYLQIITIRFKSYSTSLKYVRNSLGCLVFFFRLLTYHCNVSFPIYKGSVLYLGHILLP